MNNIELPSQKEEITATQEASLLVVVLDTNPGQKMLRDNPNILTHCIDSVIAFANSHLMQKAQNKLAIMACHSKTSRFIYPGPGKSLDIRQIDGQYEIFTLVEKTVKQNVASLLAQETSANVNESLIAGALAMALCYIARIQRTKPPGAKINCRVLVVTGSGDSASQYMNYMNVFFTAQKQNVVVDVCALDQHLSLLQQGCDITGGLYLKVPQLQGLLQYLLWVFLPEPPLREKLVLPPPVKVDYRAACFCHREMIDIGYVCSVCLSIFCKFSPICTTCQRVWSKTSKTESSIHDFKSRKTELMSEEQQLAHEIGSLNVQIENLKAAIQKLQEEAERKEVALVEIAREKERLSLDLLRQARSNSSLLKQLEEERKFYFEEKALYCKEMNEMKKIKKSLSSCSSNAPNEKPVEHYKKEIETLKQIVKQTTEANYNLSIKFLRMKNTKTCLKTELKTMQIEHEKLVNDYKQKTENMASEIHNLIEDRLNIPITASSKKYLHLVKQNSCLVYENLCLQLEVDNLKIKCDKLKLQKAKSETNSKLKYIKHDEEKPRQSEKTKVIEKNTRRVRIKGEEPEKLEKQIEQNQPSTSKNVPSKEEILKIYERNQSFGIPSIKILTNNAGVSNNEPNTLNDYQKTKILTPCERIPYMETITKKPSSKLSVFQVSNVALGSSTSSSTIVRCSSSPELFQIKKFDYCYKES